ncbi:hypothetical protein TWF970_005020 [Orbilia oligospora]|uniref:Uncharacterized protein n=1 Tax=Orbilia oligospora TaxID=2813651 RepID=A0A7C8R9E2_ORBOL|nr:hypothetical protein TWF970_005020 [Orbilia oligospora]
MLGETIRKFLLRGGLKKKQDNQKKEKNGEHVYSNRMTVVAPITLALALPEMSPAEISTEIPAIPRPAVLRDQIIHNSRVRSFSAGMLHEERSQRDRHIRYETLDRGGLKLSTVVVAAALAEWEGLEERAEREVKSHLPVPPRTAEGGEESKEMMEGGTGREFGDFTVAVPAKPAPVRDEENLVGYKVKTTHRRVAKKACLGLRRWVDSKVGSIKRPNRDPVARGFRFWLRDGVDPTVDTSCPRLYGRDRPGPKKTVHPRPWDTVLVTSATAPRAVPREVYRDFIRIAWYYFPDGFETVEEEYAAYEQWVDAERSID